MDFWDIPKVVIGRLLADETIACLQRLSGALLRRAIVRLPEDQRQCADRWEEEFHKIDPWKSRPDCLCPAEIARVFPAPASGWTPYPERQVSSSPAWYVESRFSFHAPSVVSYKAMVTLAVWDVVPRPLQLLIGTHKGRRPGDAHCTGPCRGREDGFIKNKKKGVRQSRTPQRM